MDDKLQRNKNANGGQVEHVDSIFNEFMQNQDRRINTNASNYGFNEWMDPHEQQQHQQHQQQQQQQFGLQAAAPSFPEWHPAEQRSSDSLDHRNNDYYGDYGTMGSEQISPFPNYEMSPPPQPPYYGDLSPRYLPTHDAMGMNNNNNNNNINARSQPTTRHHIQQVHPRNSTLHTTNIGARPQLQQLQQQQQQPPLLLQPNSGLFSRSQVTTGTPSYPTLAPSNLLVHQQYRPSRPYEDRYLQHTPPPVPTQTGPTYANMSQYDLSNHVRNQGTLNWNSVQMPGNNNNNNSRPNPSAAAAANRPRYPPPASNQLTMPYGSNNPNLPPNSSNFMGNNNNNNNNNAAAARTLLSQPNSLNQRSSNTMNSNSINNNSGGANMNPTANVLNRNNNDMAGRDIELEQLIYRNAKAILAETANRCLKSVELANALRDRIGKEALQRTKVLYGGLLVLLELYRETFAVHRIPKNDMVELLAYVAPQYASHTIQHPQQLLASQIPGYNISAPNLSSNNSFPNGSVIGGDSRLSNAQNTTSPTSEASQSLYQHLAKQQTPSKCLFISNVPDDITDTQIWAEFGGEDIVEKVSVDFQGDHRNGVVWFTSVNAAKAALNIPSLVKWKDVLSFIDPDDVAPPTAISNASLISTESLDDNSPHGSNYTISSTSSQPSFEEHFGPPPGLSEPTQTSYLPSSSSGRNSSQGSFFDVSVTIPEEDPFQHDDQMNLIVDLSSFGISPSKPNKSESESLMTSNTPPSMNMNMNTSMNNDSPRGSFRKAAPPPILTADLNSAIENPTPKSVQSLSPGPSPTSTPGGTPHLSFTFFDSSAPAGITVLPRETLPKPIHDVMNTLCDIYYVPQKTWEKSLMGDYLFCQAIIDILSGQFNGVFVQMTKLKQQLKRKLGGSIRIGPLKALVIAYPEYFEVDRTVNLVRSLKTELPYMDISIITSA